VIGIAPSGLAMASSSSSPSCPALVLLQGSLEATKGKASSSALGGTPQLEHGGGEKWRWGR
jgi:hypothetical protein